MMRPIRTTLRCVTTQSVSPLTLRVLSHWQKKADSLSALLVKVRR